MSTAEELAVSIRERVDAWKRIGGYSVEAETIIVLAEDVAALAMKVAALESLAKHDLVEIVETVLERRAWNEKRVVIAGPASADETA